MSIKQTKSNKPAFCLSTSSLQSAHTKHISAGVPWPRSIRRVSSRPRWEAFCLHETRKNYRGSSHILLCLVSCGSQLWHLPTVAGFFPHAKLSWSGAGVPGRWSSPGSARVWTVPQRYSPFTLLSNQLSLGALLQPLPPLVLPRFWVRRSFTGAWS